MANTRKMVIMTVVAALAIVAAGWFLLITPKNAEAADLQTKATEQAAGDGALKQKLAMLVQDEKHGAQFQARIADLKRHMPDDTGEPALIREIYKAADFAHVSLIDVTPGAPIAGTVPPPAVTATATATGSGSPSPSDSATDAAPRPAPRAQESGLSQIPVTMTLKGNYTQIKVFLDRISKFQRAFLVSGVNLTIAPADTPAAGAAPAAAGGPAGPAVPAYSGRLSVIVSGAVFSVGSPSVVGVNEPTPTPATTVVPSASPSRSAK